MHRQDHPGTRLARTCSRTLHSDRTLAAASPSRNAAHCPDWPLQPQRCFASRWAGRACGAPLTLATSASPAGLTARARPKARPGTRAASLRSRRSTELTRRVLPRAKAARMPVFERSITGNPNFSGGRIRDARQAGWSLPAGMYLAVWRIQQHSPACSPSPYADSTAAKEKPARREARRRTSRVPLRRPRRRTRTPHAPGRNR